MPSGVYVRGPRKRQDPAVRFWSFVDKGGPVPPHRPELGPCWTWLGAPRSVGYGGFHPGGAGRTMLAHRYSWRLVHGDPPIALYVLHACDNRKCVRVDHLFLGTAKDNTRDMLAKGRGSNGEAPRGEANPAATLTDAQAAAIIGALELGTRGRQLATCFGVTDSIVSRIKLRQTWGHLCSA